MWAMWSGQLKDKAEETHARDNGRQSAWLFIAAGVQCINHLPTFHAAITHAHYEHVAVDKSHFMHLFPWKQTSSTRAAHNFSCC